MEIRYHMGLCVALLLSFSNDGDAFLSPFYPRQQHHSGVFRHLKMVPPLKDAATDLYQTEEFIEKVATEGEINERSNNPKDVKVSFSHIQLYADRIEELKVYKDLEDSLNEFASHWPNENQESKDKWTSLHPKSQNDQKFISQKRDVVKQLLVGFGFRVTGYRFPDGSNQANTRSVLVTSRDPNGVQILVTAIDDSVEQTDDYHHFDSENLRRFYKSHSNRQGIAVLGFKANDVSLVHERYKKLHPNLIHSFHDYGDTQVLEVFAYYNSEKTSNGFKEADDGTVLRFINDESASSFCNLPGLIPLNASFDSTSQAAYCDHWVSNVFSRTEFLSTLEDTLGFTPKVDFNAGVVAAGEAQIESTVTGNDSEFRSSDQKTVLRDQSQVYLPINNALSEVGHVHGFLQEIGQGIQHVASRVENLVDFIQRCNDIRGITGEGFTFLGIPRSYYGVLLVDDLIKSADVPEGLARSIMTILEEQNVVAIDGAVSLDLGKETILDILDAAIPHDNKDIYMAKRDAIIEIVLRSRYKNLYTLLRENVSEESYLGIVRNQILCDVQGEDILYQIFTSNILQRKAGEEAPFFEYIQRVCSECKDEDECPVQIKPGCGGFGIRNFLTLFLSIEVSKAMYEVSEAKLSGNESARIHAQKKVDCFTSQLNDSNPILTQISDAMTLEGYCKEQMELELSLGNSKAAASWKSKMQDAGESKITGNRKLMECSARYQEMMRKLREESLQAI